MLDESDECTARLRISRRKRVRLGVSGIRLQSRVSKNTERGVEVGLLDIAKNDRKSKT